MEDAAVGKEQSAPPYLMSILPVLDLMARRVVRGIAGRRSEYRPIVSTLTDSAEPAAVAEAFRAHCGFTQLYVADLDAIQGGSPALDVYRELQARGFRLWIDAGVRDAADAASLLDCEVDTIVGGLETLRGPQALARLLDGATPRRVAFSLDLKAGRPLSAGKVWPDDAFQIAETAIALGVRRLLLLDLERVGVGAGVGTEQLCGQLRIDHPKLEISAGGGVRGPEDLRALAAAGVDYVLVASALHDGRITRADLAEFSSQ